MTNYQEKVLTAVAEVPVQYSTSISVKRG